MTPLAAPNLSWFVGINAALTVLSTVVAALVSQYKAREVSHEHLNRAVEDMQKIAEAKGERIKLQNDRIQSLEHSVLDLTSKTGRLEGHNDWLLHRKVVMDRYCEQLIDVLKQRGIPVPPLEENGD